MIDWLLLAGMPAHAVLAAMFEGFNVKVAVPWASAVAVPSAMAAGGHSWVAAENRR